MDKATRKDLKAQYRESPPMAGVYSLTNTATGRRLVDVAANLPAVENKLAFARSTNLPGALDRRIRRDVEQYGAESFRFEVLEELPHKPGQTDAEVKDDLAVLLDLWREKLAGDDLY